MPEGRKRELAPLLISFSVFDRFAGRRLPEQTTLKEILFTSFTCFRYHRCHTESSFKRQQPFQHTDRRIKRRPDGAAFRLAVPATIRQLFA